MAINTDARHAADVLRESVALQSTDFGDTQKLLDISDKVQKRELNHTPSDTHLDTYLDSDKNEQTDVNIASVPSSPSRVSFSRAPSPTPGEREPSSFMWVAVISCFCPAVPINLFALYFAHMVSSATGVQLLNKATFGIELFKLRLVSVLTQNAERESKKKKMICLILCLGLWLMGRLIM